MTLKEELLQEALERLKWLYTERLTDTEGRMLIADHTDHINFDVQECKLEMEILSNRINTIEEMLK